MFLYKEPSNVSEVHFELKSSIDNALNSAILKSDSTALIEIT